MPWHKGRNGSSDESVYWRYIFRATLQKVLGAVPFVITILQCCEKIVEGHLETQEPIIMVDEKREEEAIDLPR